MTSLTLSVCIATHNRGAFIGETLESIVSQATEQVEIVVLDGASTDNTSDIIRSWQGRFPRLRYIRQDSNMGVDHDFAEAVRLAEGEYCWLFSDDDVLKPGAISAVLEAINGGYGLIVANAEVRNADLSKLLQRTRVSFDADKVYKVTDGPQFFSDIASHLTFIGCVIIKRQLWSGREKEKYFGSYFVHAGVIFQNPLPEDALVIAKPLIAIRYGNAVWLAKYFEIWMFKWPDLVWSFTGYPDSVKLQVCPREPWRDLKNLLLHRAKGTYTLDGYVQWLEPRLGSWWTRAASKAIACFPGRIANLLFMFRLFVSRKPDRRQALLDLINSPFCFWRIRGQGPRPHVA